MRKFLAVMFNIHHPEDQKYIHDTIIVCHRRLEEEYNSSKDIRKELRAYYEICKKWGVGSPEELGNLLSKMANHIKELQKDRV